MKRRTNTLDAEYKRRGLIRPNQVARLIGCGTDGIRTFESFIIGEDIESFDWKGTSVWGVKA